MRIRVEIPALTELVNYLRERDTTQATIDKMAAEVEALTAKLQQSGAPLEEAVQSQQNQ